MKLNIIRIYTQNTNTKQRKTKKNTENTEKHKTTNNMATPQTSQNFDIKNISFSNPRMLDSGGKMVFVNYNGGKFYLQTPELEVPFDARYYGADGSQDPSDSKTGKFSIKTQLKELDSGKGVSEFRDVLNKMDDFLKEQAQANSSAWFKKPKLSMDAINELYTPFVSVSKDRDTGEPDGKYPDTFGFKINKKDDKFPDFCIYDNKKNVFDVDGVNGEPVNLLEVVQKGSLLKVVLKCNGIWIANGKFGCTWKAEQVRIKVKEEGIRDFAIESDDEDVSEDEVVPQDEKPKMMEDTESDEEKEVTEEVTEEPPPEKKKKVRRVKKASD